MSSLQRALQRGSNVDLFGAVQRGTQFKQNNELFQQRKKGNSLINQARQAQLDDRQAGILAGVENAKVEAEIDRETLNALRGDVDAISRIAGMAGEMGVDRAAKVADLIKATTPEQKAQILSEAERIEKGFTNPGAVVEFDPNTGKHKEINAGQAPLSPQQQQAQAFKERQFAATQADRLADNARADENLKLNQQAAQQRQTAAAAKAAQGPKLTADAAKSQGFSARMDATSEILNNFESDSSFDPTNISKGPLSSKKHKLYRNAAANWIRANLRLESGAVISPEEEANEYKTYFPVFGDPPEVIAQKRAFRQITAEAVRIRGGITQPNESDDNPPPGFVLDE